jgi:TPR repeat protein
MVLQPSFPVISYFRFHSCHNFSFFPKFIFALETIIVGKNPIDDFLLGLIFLNGFGIPKDEKKAFLFFQKGSKQNHPFSISLAGYCLANGIGVETNISEAIHLFQIAIQLNDSWAMNCLAELYLKGQGLEKIYQKQFISIKTQLH